MKRQLHLFDGYGIEIEYMIVDRRDWRIRPLAALLLRDEHGVIVNERCHGDLCWSNELVQHVVELKTAAPVSSLSGLAQTFQDDIRMINRLLAPHDAILLPGATHPLMDPLAETKLWEEDDRDIYQAFNAIFDCRGHGWSNLQSMHINLPFQGDDEFFRLHGAVRAILPFIPALAASSPFQDGRDTGLLDARMDHYGKNCARIPEVTGLIVPEPIHDRADYRQTILQPLYQQLKPHDPRGILQHEWANARGAIARFERDTIEIRVIDSQECPAADIGVAALICGVVRFFAEAGGERIMALNRLPTQLLHQQLRACIERAEQAPIIDPDLGAAFGLPPALHTGGDFWRHWARCVPGVDPHLQALSVIFQEGTLATRMKADCGEVTRPGLQRLCERLSRCLDEGILFQPTRR